MPGLGQAGGHATVYLKREPKSEENALRRSLAEESSEK
jgi:hypothetical protein